jgi:hypothetical protein
MGAVDRRLFKSAHALLPASVFHGEVGLFLERDTISSGHDAVPEKKKQERYTALVLIST